MGRFGRLLLSGIVLLSCLSFLLFIFTYLPVTYVDWIGFFRPAALDWRNPYYPGVFNPPWVFLLLHPLAVLPVRVGAGLLMVISLIILAWYVKTPWKVVLVGMSAPMARLVTVAQMDALSLAGLGLGWVGIPLLMAKPQGVFLAGLRRVKAKSVLLGVLVLVVSILVWGQWWEHSLDGRSSISRDWNLSFFPCSVPVGMVLVYFGLRQGSDGLLCLASLCFTPYFGLPSALPAVAGLVRESRSRFWAVVVVLASWVAILIETGGVSLG